MSRQSTNFEKKRQAQFGSYLRDLRKRRDLKQYKVAEQFSVNLSAIEKGDRPAPDRLLIELAEKYGEPLEELLRHKYWPQLPLLTAIMEPTELPKEIEDYLKELEEELGKDDKKELTRYAAFLLLRRHVANRL